MKYIAKKLIMMAFTILAISFVVFLAFRFIPGDPALMILGGQSSPEKIAALREEMGLNDPVTAQYLRWLTGILHGDFGMSYRYSIPVAGLIGEKVPITLFLTLEAFVLMVVLSVPLGIYTAKYSGGIIDRVVVVLNQIIMAVPPFFSGILITWLFGLTFRWFRPGGYVSYKVSFLSFLGYLFYPALAIALPKAAMAVKLLRSSVLSEAKLDYVRTAYSRGNATNDVLYRHVLKNSIIPVVTFLGMTLADMIAGSLIVEQVFGIPGLSKTLLTSISNRDYPVVEAIIVLIAVIVVTSNVGVDLIYRALDPRIRAEE